jgi:glucokinase
MFYLGVDIGGTKIAAGIVDHYGKVHAEERVSTPVTEGGAAILQTAIQLSSRIISHTDLAITALGIGAGGQIDCTNGTVISATDLLPGWEGQEIVSSFSNEFNIPAYADNDVNALAAGEYRFGIAHEYNTIIFLAIGTGLGGALIIDKKLYHGAHWSGGEIGQMIVNFNDDARRDMAGTKGTFEAYVSGSGLVKTWQEIIGMPIEKTGIQIAEEALQDSGSPGALAIAKTGMYLGIGLVSLVSLIDPDLIVIGGGMAALGDILIDPARAVLAERALSGPSNCPVKTASLGASSSIIGAAAIAMEAIK